MESDRLRQFTVRCLIWGVLLVAIAIALGAWITFARTADPTIDREVVAALAAQREPDLVSFGFLADTIGGFWVSGVGVCLAAVVALLILRRPYGALYVIAAQVFSALAVQALKHLFGRDRPGQMIVESDHGSYPSGHVANAATIAVVAAVLIPRLWAIILGVVWVLFMAFTRILLGAHWLTDTIGGTAVGVGVALLVTAAFAGLLERETQRGSRVGHAPA